MRHLRQAAVAVMAFALCLPASATLVDYDVRLLTGNRYEYSYRVTNDTLGVPISEFTVYFPFDLFANLGPGSAPTDWEVFVDDPEIILVPVDGLYDALTRSVPIAQGASLGGFTVEFDWLGTGLPGSQSFEIAVPDPFEVLETGTTSRAVNIPEPGGLGLLAMGLAAMLTFGSKLQRTSRLRA